jgi:hypothetical protein
MNTAPRQPGSDLNIGSDRSRERTGRHRSDPCGSGALRPGTVMETSSVTEISNEPADSTFGLSAAPPASRWTARGHPPRPPRSPSGRDPQHWRSAARRRPRRRGQLEVTPASRRSRCCRRRAEVEGPDTQPFGRRRPRERNIGPCPASRTTAIASSGRAKGNPRSRVPDTTTGAHRNRADCQDASTASGPMFAPRLRLHRETWAGSSTPEIA